MVSLDMAGMAVSNGTACSSGTVKSSHVLEALGLKPEANRCTIRISFGRDNTAEEVEQLADKLVEFATRAKNR
ncbi:MAG: aminotransferase class V-fold PLP-dependent enzyme, partial [Candidatus Marinimicrobia bacterium]|nr:aminotransferase class V-fold PLP-dependent enzyme [Candidatus Neomarinimicrobiota bacterium]